MLTANYDDDCDIVGGKGTKIWYLYPERTILNLSEIPLHLDNLRRFQGARDVTILDHLCLCVKLAKSDVFKKFLSEQHSLHPLYNNHEVQVGYAGVHDWTEWILGDIPKGLKKHLPDYQALEHKWDIYLHKAIGLPLVYRNKSFVKAIDSCSVVLEALATHHPSADRILKREQESASLIDLDTWLPVANHIIRTSTTTTKWRTILPSVKLAQKQVTPFLSLLED